MNAREGSRVLESYFQYGQSVSEGRRKVPKEGETFVLEKSRTDGEQST